jgi:hypothetical protein
MSYWKIGDVCVLRSGGIVEGDDEIAEETRIDIECRPLVVFASSCDVEIDIARDDHLHIFAWSIACAWGVKIVTDFVPGSSR